MAASQVLELWQTAKETLLPLLPYALTDLHMVTAALLPIYAGSHASLSRPASAARPRRRKRSGDGADPEDSVHRMEGLSPSDALLYPLLTGLVLTGLYYLIKWLEDPEILNKIMNWYLSSFGVFAVTRFLTDICNVVQSFILPTRYAKSGQVWTVRMSKRQFQTDDNDNDSNDSGLQINQSPLPPALWILQVISPLHKLFWRTREYLSTPLYILDAYCQDFFEASVAVGPTLQVNAVLAIGATLYFNLIDKPWWLTNIMGFSYAYGAMQLMSPTTFSTGTLVLIALFFYDIYFVFFTPMMITVATKLDMPVKLLIPRPPSEAEPLRQALSMLGLGDIILPGIMIGLALRFDLYLYYLRRQARQDVTDTVNPTSIRGHGVHQPPSGQADVMVFDDIGIGRIEYKRATGDWGERFWLGRQLAKRTGGGCFPKTYFYASIVGYVTGLVTTLVVLKIFKHGQPALLYLVPGVLLAQWGTAFFRGELQAMWEYSELEDDEANKAKRSTDIKTTKAKATLKAYSETFDDERSATSQPGTIDKESIKDDGDTELDSPSLRRHEKLPITRPKHSVLALSIRLTPSSRENKDKLDAKST